MKTLPEEQQKQIAQKAVTDIEQVLRLHGRTMATTPKSELDLLLSIYIAGATMALSATKEVNDHE